MKKIAILKATSNQQRVDHRRRAMAMLNPDINREKILHYIIGSSSQGAKFYITQGKKLKSLNVNLLSPEKQQQLPEYLIESEKAGRCIYVHKPGNKLMKVSFQKHRF